MPQSGTRRYKPGQRIAIGAAVTRTPTGVDATEVLLHASSRCFVLAGDSTVAPSNVNGIPLAADEKFHMRIAKGEYIGVTRDTADGFLNILPVA